MDLSILNKKFLSQKIFPHSSEKIFQQFTRRFLFPKFPHLVMALIFKFYLWYTRK